MNKEELEEVLLKNGSQLNRLVSDHLGDSCRKVAMRHRELKCIAYLSSQYQPVITREQLELVLEETPFNNFKIDLNEREIYFSFTPI